MPMPPSHCLMERQNSMEGLSASISGSRVAPVVVNPLIASKVESMGLVKVPSMRYGVPPIREASTQAKVTESSMFLRATYA